MRVIHLANFKCVRMYKCTPDIHVAWGKFQERDASFSLRAKNKSHAAKGISETLAMSDESTEVIILNLFITFISSVSCEEFYSAELQNYLLLL